MTAANERPAEGLSPYYSDDAVTLYLGDCFDLLPHFAAESVAAVITDPPFSERTHTMARSNSTKVPAGGRALSGGKAGFVSISDDALRAAFDEFGRITQRWVVSSLDYRHAFQFEAEPPQQLRMMRIGVWVKTNPMPMPSGDRPAQGWEAIAYLHRLDRKPSWLGGGKHGNHIGPTAQGTGHPTSKPAEMVGEWVRRFTTPGETILDPFAGSGTTLRAAKDEGRKAIGIERDERYCEMIARRLDQGVLDFGSAV